MSNDQVQGMLALIENLWQCSDELFERIEREGRWSVKHGDDWTLSDVPYHLAYFDREVVTQSIERGRNVPPAEMKVQRSMRELNEWNAAEFAKRPAGQTAMQSVEQWRAMCERTRKAVGGLQDAQLMDAVWVPLAGCGWIPTMGALGAGVAHNWSEFLQLRYVLGADSPEPMPQATHAALAFLMNFLPAFMNREAAAGLDLTILMEFTGPAGGAWTLRVHDGACEMEEASTSGADLVISQSPEVSELIRQHKLDFATEMQKGSIRVEGMQHLATFGALFPEPQLDQIMQPMAEAQAV